LAWRLSGLLFEKLGFFTHLLVALLNFLQRHFL
jgi:hypothetical protein